MPNENTEEITAEEEWRLISRNIRFLCFLQYFRLAFKSPIFDRFLSLRPSFITYTKHASVCVQPTNTLRFFLFKQRQFTEC